MINEYQGADDKAKGMTKSLSLIQLCKLWLITVLIGLISSCVKEPPEICSMGWYWFGSKKYSNFFFFLPSFIDMINKWYWNILETYFLNKWFIFQFNNRGEFIFHLWHMNDVLSYLSNVNNCWLKKKKKKSMHILNKSEKVKLNWIFHNEFIYSFLFFFFAIKPNVKMIFEPMNWLNII